MKKNKAILLILLIFNFTYILGQNADTIIIIFKNKRSINKYQLNNYIIYDDKIIQTKGKSTDSDETMEQYDNFKSIIGKGNYTIFMLKNGNIVKEGKWYIEVFDGYYFEYYKNNHIKLKGEYTKGFQIGTWTYYNRKGKIKKIEEYPTEFEKKNK